MSHTSLTHPAQELARQADALVALGYPALAGMDEPGFRALIEPLHVGLADAVADGLDLTLSRSAVPFVIVVTDALIPAVDRQVLTHLDERDKPSIVDRNHGEEGVAPYRPIEEVSVPDPPVYLLLGIERGEEFCGVTPREALPVILDRHRT
ncbi:MAG: DUF5701 family protein, partial [Demequina sp.]